MICLGVWLGVTLKPLSSDKDTRRLQQDRRALLRKTIDAICAHLFLHTYNVAKRYTNINLGRAISLSSIRGLILRYAGTKSHNFKHEKRQSENCRKKDQKLLRDYTAAWNLSRVERFIEDVGSIASGWRELVKESKYLMIMVDIMCFCGHAVL